MAGRRQANARVLVRAPTPSDRAAYLEAMRSSRKLHGRWVSPASDETFDRLLRCVRDERYEPGLVCRLEDGPIAGFINVNEIVRGLFQSGYSATPGWPRTRVRDTCARGSSW